ncbi:hypothetical protein [Streptomyces rimosus]|uniref:hypothetical protein n=1 Tax=Streptomyces rimosus TaxID=1927 RepID=UPI0018FE15DD|nr:hypothetical protein [Streptomyces rimosus]
MRREIALLVRYVLNALGLRRVTDLLRHLDGPLAFFFAGCGVYSQDRFRDWIDPRKYWIDPNGNALTPYPTFRVDRNDQ